MPQVHTSWLMPSYRQNLLIIGSQDADPATGEEDQGLEAFMAYPRLRKLGRTTEAAAAYLAAVELASNERERAFLRKKLTELRASSSGKT